LAFDRIAPRFDDGTAASARFLVVALAPSHCDAVAAFAAEVGVVEQDLAVEAVQLFMLGHDVQDLVVHQPGRRITHA
jgi:hypothetical protein